MLQGLELLASPRISSRRLFALKQLAEALDGDLLTLKQASRGASRIAPEFATVFDGQPGQAAEVIQINEVVLQKRFPGRFRATSCR
jgi:hypothetical protein